MEDLRVAIGQVNSRVGQFERNIEKHRDFARRAAQAKAKIICFPETSLTGYPTTNSVPHELAQPLDGPLGEAMAQVSAETGLMILAGMVERDRSGVLYNTQLVASPTGLVGGYRKVHVGNSEIHRFYHGDDLAVFPTKEATFGVQICYDNHFPEGSRTLALRGAEVIFCPYGSPGPCTEDGVAAKQGRWLKYLPARAFDNSVYVVLSNLVGPGDPSAPATGSVVGSQPSTSRDTHVDMPEFPGGSLVLNPWGEVIAKAGPKEDLLIVDLPAATILEKRSDALQFFTHFRRPELYGELVRPSRAPAGPGAGASTV